MAIQDRRVIRNTAADALTANPGDPRKTALIYIGSTVLLGLLSTVITYVLGLKINNTGGLGNMGLRSILSTIQMVIPMAQSIFVLFLGFGYQSAVLQMARRQHRGPGALMDGFHIFGPLVRLMLLQFAICMGLAFVATYLGSQIFLMTPLATKFLEIMMPLLSSTSALTTQITLDEATLTAATEAMMPAFLIVVPLFLAVAAPIFYQYRMSTFALFDNPGRGAFAAMRESRGMMKGNRVGLFKLDLGFWWFYVLDALIMALCYGDKLLPMIGITLPWSDTVSYFLFYILSLLLQAGVYYLFLNRVNVTYATVYEMLRPRQEEQKVALGNIFEM